MSRAFTPPDTLSKDEIRTLGDVRRSIWTNGFTGLLVGSISGYVLHATAQFVHNRLPESTKLKVHAPGEPPLKFSRNTAFLSVMVGAAVGSFSMATAAGKNRSHELHDIYEVGKDPMKGATEYQRSLHRAQIREEEIRERERRRVARRATVKRIMEEGHGLSDSHAGRWVDDDGSSSSSGDRG